MLAVLVPNSGAKFDSKRFVREIPAAMIVFKTMKLPVNGAAGREFIYRTPNANMFR